MTVAKWGRPVIEMVNESGRLWNRSRVREGSSFRAGTLATSPGVLASTGDPSSS